MDVFEGIAVFGDPGDLGIYYCTGDAELADRLAAGFDRVVGGAVILLHVLRDRKIRGSEVQVRGDLFVLKVHREEGSKVNAIL